MEVEKKLGQGSAFPCNMELPDRYGGKFLQFIPGITQRYYTAVMILQGLCSSDLISTGSFDFKTRGEEKIKLLVQTAYELTDELLEQEYENKQ